MSGERIGALMRRWMDLGPLEDLETERFWAEETQRLGGRARGDWVRLGVERHLNGLVVTLDGTVWLVDMSGPDGSPVYYDAEVGCEVEEAFRVLLEDPLYVRGGSA